MTFVVIFYFVRFYFYFFLFVYPLTRDINIIRVEVCPMLIFFHLYCLKPVTLMPESNLYKLLEEVTHARKLVQVTLTRAELA